MTIRITISSIDELQPDLYRIKANHKKLLTGQKVKVVLKPGINTSNPAGAMARSIMADADYADYQAAVAAAINYVKEQSGRPNVYVRSLDCAQSLCSASLKEFSSDIVHDIQADVQGTLVQTRKSP